MKKINDSYGNIKLGMGITVAEVDNNGSIAVGNFCESKGRNSIAIGGGCGEMSDTTKALGDFAIAIGSAITANAINNLGEVKIGSPQYNAYYYDGGTGWKVGSDIRDKIAITEIPNALEFISSIQPIRFRYNYRRSYSNTNSLTDYDHEQHVKGFKAEKQFSYGVRAQEVAETLKSIYGSENYGQIVSKTHEATLEGIEDCYTINMTNFIPFLIGAIREQQKQIEALQQRVVELEEKINE